MKNIRLFLLIFSDLLICFIALYLSYSLIYQEFINFKNINLINYFFSSSLIISIFLITKIYFYRTRFLSNDILDIYLKSILTYFVLFYLFNEFLLSNINLIFDSNMVYGTRVPRSVLIVNCLLLFIFIKISRHSINTYLGFYEFYKQFKKGKTSLKIKKENNGVCIYGAGNLGNSTLNFLTQFKKNVDVLTFIDDNKNLHSQMIKGIKIRSLKKITSSDEYKKSILYVAIKNFDYKKIKDLGEKYSNFFKRIVFLSDEHGNLKINNLHNEAFEIDINKIIPTEDYSIELLKQKNLFNDKNILITGCAGSIGRELVMQVINYNPRNLYLLDKNEHQLFQLERYINTLGLNKYINIKYLLINLENNDLINKLKIKEIDTIFHAAAYKHVDMAEKNIASVMYNNILSTYNISKFAVNNNVKNFVNISTDKAVKPKSIMGLSKRICEIIISQLGKNKNYYSVRFGNVINSSGSVIPIFIDQIVNNEKITISNIDVTRFFMSIPEAISLILLSINLDKNKNIFILDMGQPIKIIDIAKKLCLVYKKKLVKEKKSLNEIEYIITGLKEGEKLHEELSLSTQEKVNTEIKKIFKIKDSFDEIHIDGFIKEFKENLNNETDKKLREFLFSKI